MPLDFSFYYKLKQHVYKFTNKLLFKQTKVKASNPELLYIPFVHKTKPTFFLKIIKSLLPFNWNESSFCVFSWTEFLHNLPFKTFWGIWTWKFRKLKNSLEKSTLALSSCIKNIKKLNCISTRIVIVQGIHGFPFILPKERCLFHKYST